MFSLYKRFFASSSFGLDIRDESIRYVKLLKDGGDMTTKSHGEIQIPEGVIEAGVVKDKKKFEEILKSLQKKEGIKSARVYMLDGKEYVSIFKNAGINAITFESRAVSIARCVIKKGDADACVIVDFGKTHTGVFMVLGSDVFAVSFLDTGADTEREKIADELVKYLLCWHTRLDKEGKMRHRIKKIVLCGDGENLEELASYLSVKMKTKVNIANVWVNILDTEKHTPEMSFDESLPYASAMGLALGGFR